MRKKAARVLGRHRGRRVGGRLNRARKRARNRLNNGDSQNFVSGAEEGPGGPLECRSGR